MKKIFLSSLVATVFLLASCLKDDEFGGNTYGIGESGVKGIGFKATSRALALNSQTAAQSIYLIVGLNGSETSSTPINYTVTSTPALVTGTVTQLPASGFTFATSGTIPAGQYFDTLEVVLPNSSLLDPTKIYGIGLTVTATDPGYVTMANFSTTLVTFSLKNKYDGVYSVTGTMVDFSSAANVGRYPLEFELVTTGPSSVDVKMVINGALVPGYLFSAGGAGSFFGSFGLTMSFDPATDAISDLHNYYGDPTKSANDIGNPALGSGAPNYASSNGRRAALDPTGLNKWDPATKIISIKYFMFQPSVTPVGPRIAFNETWKYVRARS